MKMSWLLCIFPARWAWAGIFVSPSPGFVIYRVGRPEEPPISAGVGKGRMGMADKVLAQSSCLVSGIGSIM